MADTRAQVEAEDWIRREWMRKEFGQAFSRERLKLSAGGVFDFDAVSADGQVVAAISTSCGKTAGGKYPVGKVHKLRSDIFFLTMIDVPRRLIVLTEPDMLKICQREAEAGRLPKCIEFRLASLPADLAERLTRARERSSLEVRPSGSAR